MEPIGRILRLTYQLTRDEYFQFNYYTTWTAPERRKYRRLYYARVLLLYASIALFYIIVSPRREWMTNTLVFGFIAFTYILLVPHIIRRSIRRRTQQILEKADNRNILEETELTLSPGGIAEKDKASESFYQWDAIVKKAETPTQYYLYTNSYHAIVIPKRVLQQAEEKAQLEALLARHLPLSSDC